IAPHHGKWLHILGHDAARTDDCALAHGYAFEDDRARAYPRAAANADRAGRNGVPVVGASVLDVGKVVLADARIVAVVIAVHQQTIIRNKRVVVDLDARGTID